MRPRPFVVLLLVGCASSTTAPAPEPVAEEPKPKAHDFCRALVHRRFASPVEVASNGALRLPGRLAFGTAESNPQDASDDGGRPEHP